MSSAAVLAPSPSLIQKVPPKNILPIIVDDFFDSARSKFEPEGEDRENGLWASVGAPAALLSMSGYEKTPYHDPKDYEPTIQSRRSMYLGYGQPEVPEPAAQAGSIPSTRQADDVPYAASTLFQPRIPLDQTNPPPTEYPLRSGHVPEVANWTPRRGPEGTQVVVYLACVYDLNPSWSHIITVGDERCTSNLTRLQQQGPHYNFALEAKVPPLAAPVYPGARVPIHIQILDSAGHFVAGRRLGEFEYTTGGTRSPGLSSELSRKRKLQDDKGDISRSSSKRTPTLRSRVTRDIHENPPVDFLQQPSPTYFQQPPSLAVEASMGNVLSDYRSRNPPLPQSPSSLPQNLGAAQGSSSLQPRGQSPQTPSWSNVSVTGSHLPNSPSMPAPAMNRIAAASSPKTITNPPLVRTSTLHQSPSPAGTPPGSSSQAGFNPYAMYPMHKAMLKLNGSLDSMAEGWNQSEYEAKRRLVQFWRNQSGNTITSDFKPVAPDDRQPHSVCISCILWESKNEYYVTSVDTIYLLEQILNVRFTVEEKNRIRRNLEGFRPMTVSKGKPDSEGFFKLIMGFPNPKPRNIEKDVKVFPWTILSHALKKIVGKYSASYASTAGSLTGSVGPSYHGSQADLGGDLVPASPHTPDTSTYHHPEGQRARIPQAFPTLAHSIQPPPYSPAQFSYNYDVTTAPVVGLPSAQDFMLRQPQEKAPSLQPTQSPQQQQQQQHQHQQPPLRAPPWDFATFMDTPTSASIGQGLYTLDPTHESGGQYQMTQSSSGP